MSSWKPLKGMKFGKLTVVDDIEDNSKPKGVRHYCKCICELVYKMSSKLFHSIHYFTDLRLSH